jgi:flagellin
MPFVGSFNVAPSLNAFATHTRALNTAMERLATGKRINRAADDPSGSIAADQLSADIRSKEKEIERSTRDLAFMAAKDGAFGAVGELMIELEGLVVAAANRGALTKDEREAYQLQVDSILRTIDHLADTQTFNDQKLLDEAYTHKLAQSSIAVKNADGSTSSRPVTLKDLRSGGAINLVDGDLEQAQRIIKDASGEITGTRGAIGRRSQEIESRARVAASELEELTKVKSAIVDADYAQEVSNMIRAQVLQEASLMMASMTMKSAGDLVLSLVQGSRR